jgi:YVTN family beta-propeller protein
MPIAFAADSAKAAPKVYIGLFKDDSIAVLDTESLRVLRLIPVPKGPHGLVMSLDGGRVYASSDGDSKVSVIDTGRDSVVASIEVGPSPHGLAMTPDGTRLLVAGFGTDSVVFVDTSTDSVIGRVAVPSPHNIAISPDGLTAYVAAQKKGSTGIAIIDISGMKSKGFFPLDKAPRALGFGLDGKLLYFTLAGSDSLQVYDIAAGTVSAQVSVGASPHYPLATRDGATVLVVCQGPGELDLVNAASASLETRIAVGTMPHWIAFSSGGSRALVTNEGSNNLSVVDLASRKVVAIVAVGNAPRKIVVQPASRMAELQVKAEISAFSFPDLIRAKVGQAVTWTNLDSVPHSVTSDDGGWDSGPIAMGQSFTKVFDRAGSYAYHCAIHPSMTGSVLVLD